MSDIPADDYFDCSVKIGRDFVPSRCLDEEEEGGGAALYGFYGALPLLVLFAIGLVILIVIVCRGDLQIEVKYKILEKKISKG